MIDNRPWFEQDLDVEATAHSEVAKQFGVSEDLLDVARDYLNDVDMQDSEIQRVRDRLATQMREIEKYSKTGQRSFSNLTAAKQRYDAWISQQMEDIASKRESIDRCCREINNKREELTGDTSDLFAQMTKISNDNKRVSEEIKKLNSDYISAQQRVTQDQEKFGKALTTWKKQARDKKDVFDKFVLKTEAKMNEFDNSMQEAQEALEYLEETSKQFYLRVDKQFQAKASYINVLSDTYAMNVGILTGLKDKAQEKCASFSKSEDEASKAFGELEAQCRKYTDLAEVEYERARQEMEDAQNECTASYNMLKDADKDITETIANLKRLLEERKHIDRKVSATFQEAELIAQNCGTYLHNLKQMFVADIQKYAAFCDTPQTKTGNSATNIGGLDMSNGLDDVYSQVVEANKNFEVVQERARQAAREPEQPVIVKTPEHQKIKQSFEEMTTISPYGPSNSNPVQSTPEAKKVPSVKPVQQVRKTKKTQSGLGAIMDNLDDFDVDEILGGFESTIYPQSRNGQSNWQAPVQQGMPMQEQQPGMQQVQNFDPNYNDNYGYGEDIPTGMLPDNGGYDYYMSGEYENGGYPQVYEGDDALATFDNVYVNNEVSKELGKKKTGFLGRFRK